MDIKGFKKIERILQRTVQLFITQKCNLDCGFCFRREKGFKIPDMKLEDAKKIIAKYAGKNAKISFTGGEPTLHPNLEEMLRFCSDIGIDSEIYTNGIRHFNNFDTKVRLRYDGFDDGLKCMKVKRYKGSYELGLLVSGSNTEQLLKCLETTENDANFSGIIQITEVVGKDRLPICGIEAYVKETECIAGNAAENHDKIRRIEISVGYLRKNTSFCRFKRYFGNKIAGICPHNINPSECTSCHFQKEIYVREVEKCKSSL